MPTGKSRTNFAKLSAHIMSNQSTLHLSNQIARGFIQHESHRATTPSTGFVEVSKPFAVLPVLGIEYNEWAGVQI
jgi:hypothetical protein